jgi:predicted NBD/HSP70 family sugar kinase
LFIDTFVGGGVVVDGRIRFGVRGNAGAVASLPTGLASKSAVRPSAKGRGARPDQLVQHASLWELERRLSAAKLDPMAAYDARALEKPYRAATQAWVAQAAPALAQCIVAGAAFLDVHAIILDGSFVRPLLDWLLAETREAVARYNREGMWDTPVLAGTIGADARALGGALLPLNATFSPDREAFLKVV